MLRIFWRRYAVKTRRKRRKRKASLQYVKYKEHTRTLVHERLEHFNAHYGFDYKKVFIKNQVSRWGSCSNRGNLNFNYRIAMLPSHLADYIIVHELCHLGEFNHSENFWDLMEETLPNARELRDELRRVRMKH